MSKSTLAEPIRDYTIWILKHYSQTKAELEAYKNSLIPSPITKYNAEPGGSAGEHRPTEMLAYKLMTDVYGRNQEQVIHALDSVLAQTDPDTRKLIDLLYWKNTHSIEGAALVLNWSRKTAYNKLNAVLTAIALELGLITI